MKYIPGLNGIRAIAALIVVVFHWTLPVLDQSIFLRYILPNGNFGVNIFFVLSGFLITAILLIEKEKAIAQSSGYKKIFKHFYIRRVLRIFPVYYVALVILYYSGLPEFKGNFIYYLSYTENFHVWITQYWDSFCHTWSLAVEEQFYLIWPVVILYTRKSRIVPVLIAFIIAGPTFSLLQSLVLKNNFYVLMPSCFDAFGIGALLAFCYINRQLDLLKKWIKILLPFSILLYIYWKLAPTGGHFQYFKRFFDSIIGCGLILFCLSNSYTSFRNKILENTVMKQLGIVSYGIYLLHYPIPYFYGNAKQYFHISFGSYNWAMDYLLMFIILFTLAFASYYLFEKPILSLKKKFEY